jgi:hypothetical protein
MAKIANNTENHSSSLAVPNSQFACSKLLVWQYQTSGLFIVRNLPTFPIMIGKFGNPFLSVILTTTTAAEKTRGLFSNQGTIQRIVVLLLHLTRNIMETYHVLMDKLVRPVKREDYEELTRMVVQDSINYSAPVTLNNEDIVQILKTVTSEE